MKDKKKKEKTVVNESTQQHLVMLTKPYHLIYNEEITEAAIQIGTLNIVSGQYENGALMVECYPVIQRLNADDYGTDGMISLYPICNDLNKKIQHPWIDICQLNQQVNIEDLFKLFSKFNLEYDDTRDIVLGLMEKGYEIHIPQKKVIRIYLMKQASKNGEIWITRKTTDKNFVNLWFNVNNDNITEMIIFAKLYDLLYNLEYSSWPVYGFQSNNPEMKEKIEHLNEIFMKEVEENRKTY